MARSNRQRETTLKAPKEEETCTFKRTAVRSTIGLSPEMMAASTQYLRSAKKGIAALKYYTLQW